jgi:hypothetical protein
MCFLFAVQKNMRSKVTTRNRVVAECRIHSAKTELLSVKTS